jgi:hypothetical protein
MLGGRDLAGRALDQRGQLFMREPTNLNAPTRSLRVELRPVGEVSGRRVEQPRQAAQRAVMDVGPDLSDLLATLVSPVLLTPLSR